MRNARKYFRLHKVSLVKILKRREALKIFTPKSSIKENGGSFLRNKLRTTFYIVTEVSWHAKRKLHFEEVKRSYLK